MIYLDNNATTPLRESVRQKMVEAMDVFGNASAVYAAGRDARLLLDLAHRKVGAYFNVRSEQVVFTSGGTESDVMAMVGFMNAEKNAALITSKAEHPALLETATKLKHKGSVVRFLNVDENGLISLDDLEELLKEEDEKNRVPFVSLMYVHNETGTVRDMYQISKLCKKYNAFLHIDAVQAVGKLPQKDLDFVALGADMMSISFHKFGGPKGVGALVMKSELTMEALLSGGAQERNRRAGTENTLAIAGALEAVQSLSETKAFEAESAHVKKLNEKLEQGLKALNPNLRIVGEGVRRTGATTCFFLEGVDAETAMLSLDMAGIAASRGSACSSGRSEPSKALLAMGYSADEAKSALRISFAWHNTLSDVEAFLSVYKSIEARALKV